jgi:hypothetical protein
VTAPAHSEATRRHAVAHPEDRKRLDPERCDVCAHIATHGWTGLGRGTHCRNCHAVFGGQQAHCALCHRTFSTNGVAARAHSTTREADGELRRRCLDPAGIAYFAQPEPNRWGTPIWRGRDRAEIAHRRRRALHHSAAHDRAGT